MKRLEERSGLANPGWKELLNLQDDNGEDHSDETAGQEDDLKLLEMDHELGTSGITYLV